MATKRITNSERENMEKTLRDNKLLEIDRITTDDPLWERRVKERQRKVAIGKLGIEALLKKKEETEAKREEAHTAYLKLKKQVEKLDEEISEKLPLRKLKDHEVRNGICAMPMSLCDALGQVEKGVRRQVMTSDPIGKRVLEIEDAYQRKESQLETCESRERAAELGIFEMI